MCVSIKMLGKLCACACLNIRVRTSSVLISSDTGDCAVKQLRIMSEENDELCHFSC